jgi:hypothetical protein
LKLKYDAPLSTFAFNFKLRHCIKVIVADLKELKVIGRAVHVQPIKPVLKAPGSVILKLRYG